jgi:hypothetical protein
MKKFLTSCGLLCVMFMVTLATPAALPSYAGTWVLDKEKSKDLPAMMANMGAIEMTVTQDNKQISVKTSVGSGDVIAYMLDGSKTKAQLTGRMPGEATVYMEKKDDGKIVLHVTRELNFQGNAVTINITDNWELADAGKTLHAKRKIESPQGTQEMELVFTLKA